jgi:hypothetical protein
VCTLSEAPLSRKWAYRKALEGFGSLPRGNPGYVEEPRGTPGYLGIPQGYPGIPRGTPGYPEEPRGIPRNPEKPGVPRVTPGYPGVPRYNNTEVVASAVPRPGTGRRRLVLRRSRLHEPKRATVSTKHWLRRFSERFTTPPERFTTASIGP